MPDLIAGRIQTVKEEYRVVNRVNGCKHIDWVEARAAVESYDEKRKTANTGRFFIGYH